MKRIKYCENCLQSDTRPGITLNSRGVCSACEGHREKFEVIDWTARRKALDELFDHYRKSKRGHYDCIIPVSGGKDSTYQTYIVKEVYGLNPLCVTYRTPLRTPLGQRNLDNLQSRFGVDLLELSISPETERKFILKATRELGVPALPMHLGIFSFTLRTAVQMNIPLIVWGENAQLEYGGTAAERHNEFLNREWLARHGCLHEREAADWANGELSMQELAPYIIPSEEEFKRTQINSFFLGQYLRWDPQENARVAIEHGFLPRKEGPIMGIYDFADLDCYMISFHHYVKWLKFGMTRTFDNVAIEIRNGRMTREQGLAKIRQNKDDRPLAEHLEKLCAFLKVSETELFGLIERFRNTNIWKRDASDNWYIDGYLDFKR